MGWCSFSRHALQRIAPGSVPLNKRQAKLFDRLLDGFEGTLTSSKWAAIAKRLPDTTLERR